MCTINILLLLLHLYLILFHYYFKNTIFCKICRGVNLCLLCLAVLGFNLLNRNRTKRHLICIQQVPGRSKVTWGRPLERRGALWVLFRIQNVNHRQQCILMGLIFVSLFKTLRLVVLLEVDLHNH